MKKQWRLVSQFLEQIYLLIKALGCRSLSKVMQSDLLDLLADNQINESLKPSVALLLSGLLYNNCRKHER
jgi:hypothetical protein